MSQREQQTVRGDLNDATWQPFRSRAIPADRSVADELARLVHNDLHRCLPTEPPNRSNPRRRRAAIPGALPRKR